MPTNDLTETVRRAGFRATTPRLRILSLLKKTRYPLSIADIMKSLGRSLDQVTVYRVLDAFKKVDIVQQVDFQHGHAHFELKDKKQDHHHIVCTSCDRVEDFTDDSHSRLAERVVNKSRSFSGITSHSFELYGLCNNCLKRT
ncbi:hypothetical protein COU18_02985 [Candidatus Kaiserbacteria bacterium CG10_big_fil_rev_8_21_14_0_10_51_14]|uniref:Transcriptional repressor n=1 Tax=Candidatus Kaiserbacteria bacterium CG10_big_fil_rev_8_21_14_0_10_51_14 TaxID=1974610 RepID=A0A2H0UB49_9BACT|nr:MAG: hypothetical protein COU18_02985 [Candidatus Kaiserbacteria bacterium CG10_big_fil_rev_8_21_14_0_10_51_14]